MTEAPSGTGSGYTCKGNTGGAAAMALRAACSRINKTDNTQDREGDEAEFIMSREEPGTSTALEGLANPWITENSTGSMVYSKGFQKRTLHLKNIVKPWIYRKPHSVRVIRPSGAASASPLLVQGTLASQGRRSRSSQARLQQMTDFRPRALWVLYAVFGPRGLMIQWRTAASGLRDLLQLRPKRHQQMFRRRRLQKPKEYRFRHSTLRQDYMVSTSLHSQRALFRLIKGIYPTATSVGRNLSNHSGMSPSRHMPSRSSELQVLATSIPLSKPASASVLGRRGRPGDPCRSPRARIRALAGVEEAAAPGARLRAVGRAAVPAP